MLRFFIGSARTRVATHGYVGLHARYSQACVCLARSIWAESSAMLQHTLLSRMELSGWQAATDGYIYTSRGFSISRFVECRRRKNKKNGAQLLTTGIVQITPGRICICQKLARPQLRAADGNCSDARLNRMLLLLAHPIRDWLRRSS